jgi:hypothetical protein
VSVIGSIIHEKKDRSSFIYRLIGLSLLLCNSNTQVLLFGLVKHENRFIFEPHAVDFAEVFRLR